MAPSRLPRAFSEFLVGTGAMLGVFLVALGLWLLYGGVVNVDPESEIPRWLLFAFAAPALVIGAGLLMLTRRLVRSQCKSPRPHQP